MAGGNWLVQNKVRAGAYINFKPIVKTNPSVGDRGVILVPMPMSWGGKSFSLLSKDLKDGTSKKIIGFDAFDEESLIFREALKYCFKGYFYRIDTGGKKAELTLDTLKVTAKYEGVVGNSISILCKKRKPNDDDNKLYTVFTLYRGAIENEQDVEKYSELESNDWVDFEATDQTKVADEFVATPLKNGENGTINNSSYADFLKYADTINFNTMGVPSKEEAITNIIRDAVIEFRNNGKKVQAVLYKQANADSEGIISTDQGYETSLYSIPEDIFPVTIASMTAGAAVNESNTYRRVLDATKIINEKTDEEIKEGLKNGEFLISLSTSNKIIVEKDINTLVSYENYSLTKNRVIRCLDEINNTIKITWEDMFIGKRDNNDDGRNIFKGACIAYFETLQSISCITNFDSKNDIIVMKGIDADSVLTDVYVQPVDSMEKLYMTVFIN